MALSKERLKQKLKTAFSHPHTETNIDTVAGEIAQAIIEEIKELKILYTSGLIAPNGAVTGQIKHTVK